MLLGPEHANPTPPPPSPPSIKSPPPLHSPLPFHRPPRSDPSQTGRHRRLGSPAPNPSPLDLHPDLQLHHRFDVIVLNSVVQPSSSSEMEFVVTDFRS
ncbi:hypothetical protein ACFXTH_041831 [Malus domestica]